VFLKFYPAATITHQHLKPENISVKSIGHFGFFRKKHKSDLWTKTTEWLDKTFL
jgi:predicted alpha/beta hydrolase